MQQDFNSTFEADEEEDFDSLRGKYLTFWADRQLFGVRIADVVQIVGIQQITPIPEFPPYAKGVINLRGSMVPVIDIRLRLHKEPVEYSERTCIIITTFAEVTVGFVVDEVDQVAYIAEENICPPPQSISGCSSAFLTGIGKLPNAVVLLLDLSKILSGDEVEQISCAQQ